ncbi:gamma-glutamyltransferase [Marinococcus luteus]|uniref:gamma-glutamyltransferase n=1 Tax=Marinococcus luteus TaxID=1122204 RepID=UPI002ACC8C92|nr:gamma-glutamyltransferase [Marinococcus luteus]MDZ5782224.1 gamma-glutamyltransferase [Marinococcus luteus]
MNAQKITYILAAVVVAGLLIYVGVTNFGGSDQSGSDSEEESAQNDSNSSSGASSDIASGSDYEGYGVSTDNELATDAGMEILEQGGNAADAAVATSFALTVTEPYGSGIGGGGAALAMDGPNGTPATYDYREEASTTDRGANSGVPGFVRGMETLLEEEGSGQFTLAELMDPAIEYAEDGFEINNYLSQRMAYAQPRLNQQNSPDFFGEDGEPLSEGETLVQEEYAQTLRTLQEEGPESFYSADGSIAQQLTTDHPHITTESLQQYDVQTPNVAQGTFEGQNVYSAPSPLSGVTLIQMLGMGERLNIGEALQGNEADYIHTMSAITREAYYQRLENLGDPAFNEITTEEYVSEGTIDDLAQNVREDRLDTEELETEVGYESSDGQNTITHSSTTHVNVMDENGNTVALTNTLGNFFGSGQTSGGMFLNNQLNNYNETESSPNNIEVGKRPRSFIAPTIVQDPEEGTVMGIGSPGGSRIPAAMAEVIFRMEYLDQSYEEAFAANRSFVDVVEGQATLAVENGDEAENAELIEEINNKYGDRYLIAPDKGPSYFGNVTALIKDYDDEEMQGIIDQRRGGSAQTQ